MHGSCHHFGAGHGIADRDAFDPRGGDGVLLLPRASFPISAGEGFRFFLRVSCLPGFASFACCHAGPRFQTLAASCGASLVEPRRIRAGLLPRACHTTTALGGLTLRRGLIFDQAVTSQKFHSERKIMKSFILAIALACAAVVGSVQAAGTSCPKCCKDKDCATCCKGKCSECKQCNK